MPLVANSVRVILTLVFAATALICVRRCVASATASRRNRVNDAAHVLMSAEMIAMVWAWSVPDPLGLQIVALSVAAAWFAVQATGVPLTRAGLVIGPVTSGRSCGGHVLLSRAQCLHHAILLAMMVWMMVPLRDGRSMPGMPEMSPLGARAGAVIAGYCLLTAIVWLVYARRDVRTITPYATMTAAMGVMVLVTG